MKKLVSGMFTVGLLQAAFIAYHASDPSSGTAFLQVSEAESVPMIASRVSSPQNPEQNIADIEVPIGLPDDSDAGPRVQTASYRVRPVYRRSSPAVKPRQFNTYVASRESDELRPVKVVYNLHPPVEFKRPAVERIRTEYPVSASVAKISPAKALAAKGSEPKKKRNLFVRVVTKPYDWLKAVGSAIR